MTLRGVRFLRCTCSRITRTYFFGTLCIHLYVFYCLLRRSIKSALVRRREHDIAPVRIHALVKGREHTLNPTMRWSEDASIPYGSTHTDTLKHRHSNSAISRTLSTKTRDENTESSFGKFTRRRRANGSCGVRSAVTLARQVELLLPSGTRTPEHNL